MNQNMYTDYNLNFLKGVFYIWQSDYEQAKYHFFKALSETDSLDRIYPVFQSYLGLSEVLDEKKSGVYDCYQSLETDSTNIEILLNLACSELYTGHRRRAIQALNAIHYSQLSSRDLQIIKSFFKLVGKREINDKYALKRNSIKNRVMGKMFRHNGAVSHEKIETFIKESIEIRYEKIIVRLFKHDLSSPSNDSRSLKI